MSSRSFCIISVASGLHFACCWVTSYESYNITMSIYDILSLPSSPLMAFVVPFDDPAPFYLLITANSVLWGLLVYSITYTVLRTVRGEFGDWKTRIRQQQGKFSVLFLMLVVSFTAVEFTALLVMGFANWFSTHFVASLVLSLTLLVFAKTRRR